jgi:hypothetical protein
MVIPRRSALSSSLACRAVFPGGRWQFTHAIEAALPGGQEALLMGVTVVDAVARTVDCALMTVEGFVIFQARAGETRQVRRAMPPFDREGFAAGMLADIQLIFLEPAGRPGRAGLPVKPAAGPVCRYTVSTGGTIDVRPGPGPAWQIEQYTPGGRLSRTVAARPAGGLAGFPGRLRLEAAGPAGYTLNLKLIDAVPVTD